MAVGEERIAVRHAIDDDIESSSTRSKDATRRVDKIGPTSLSLTALRSFPPTQQVNTRGFFDTVPVLPTQTPGCYPRQEQIVLRFASRILNH